MGKIAIITGGRSNLGGKITENFKSSGFTVFSPDSSELNIVSDVSCRDFVRKVAKTNKKVDILVNCAGITPVGLSLEETPDHYVKTLNINAVGAFRLAKEVVHYMPSGGKIINISSLNGISALPNYGIYSASKHALEAMSFAMRQELRSKNIWVTSILPGAILSERRNAKPLVTRSAREKFFLLKILMPFLTAEKVAKLVLRVAKEDAPPARVILGNDALILTFLMRILPFDLWDRLTFYVWNHK